MRRVLVVVLGLCLFAGACSGGSDVAQVRADRPTGVVDTTDATPDPTPDVASGPPGERVRIASQGWESVAAGDSPNAAVVSFTGRPAGDLDASSCAGEYDVELVETDIEVRITVYELALANVEPSQCILLGEQRDITVTLDRPFAGRTFIDGHDGSTKLEADPAAPEASETAVVETEDTSIAWSAAESTRDVANYLEALRQGAYEQAAWPAYGNGILFDGQSADETGAQYLAGACGGGLCNGPYLVRGQEGVILQDSAQSVAAVTVAHFEAGERAVITLLTFEGQRVIAQLPPLVDSVNEASLRESLFGDSQPQHVVVERFDAFEIWDGGSTTWVTNWFAADATHIEGDVVATWSGAFGVSDPQEVIAEGCTRLMERNGDVLALAGCDGPWTLTNVSTGAVEDAPIAYRQLSDGESLWFTERGGSVLTGQSDAEGNLQELTAPDGTDLLADDYASQVVISGDGTHVAYVDHNDSRASSHFWSPVVVVRTIATGEEVGRWAFNSSVICLDYAVDWLIVCEADDTTLAAGQPDQVALAALNPTTGELNRVTTATRVFLPSVPPTPDS